ncbi:hypothetical protein ACFQH6_20660 [Halobacteriaceae archaeon GCM10025711]
MGDTNGFLVPEWAASQSDITWPWTYVLAFLVASMAIAILYGVPYARSGESLPRLASAAIIVVFFIVVPVLAFRESTEVLFDGTRLALRVLAFGLIFFTIVYWLTPGVDGAFANPQRIAAFILTTTALYASAVLGVAWIIQYTRKGTSGVDYEFQ